MVLSGAVLGVLLARTGDTWLWWRPDVVVSVAGAEYRGQSRYFVQRFGGLDPWGHKWCIDRSKDLVLAFYSSGPDGVDSRLTGDDIEVLSRDSLLPWYWIFVWHHELIIAVVAVLLLPCLASRLGRKGPRSVPRLTAFFALAQAWWFGCIVALCECSPTIDEGVASVFRGEVLPAVDLLSLKSLAFRWRVMCVAFVFSVCTVLASRAYLDKRGDSPLPVAGRGLKPHSKRRVGDPPTGDGEGA